MSLTKTEAVDMIEALENGCVQAICAAIQTSEVVAQYQAQLKTKQPQV